MNLVPAALSKAVAHRALLTQKASPTLLLGAGIVGMTASTVLACRATLKMHEILETANDDLDVARSIDDVRYSEKDRSSDIRLIQFKTGVKIVKAYAPAIVLGGISIYAITSSHGILTRRNAALTAAYATLDKGFREYRARVVDKFGEQTDQELRYGTRKDKIVKENGKTKNITRVSMEDPSIYARFFDEGSGQWSRDPETNFIFLKIQQNYWNDRLRARGHVFLNEVYDALGLEHTKAGSVVGWVFDPEGEEGDNFINFGLFDDREKVRDFVNGREGSILLDFNVDGIIYDKLGD